MFKNRGNYEYFLRQCDKYLSPVIDTYAYCLLGNHFHLLIRIGDLKALTAFKKLANPQNLQSHRALFTERQKIRSMQCNYFLQK